MCFFVFLCFSFPDIFISRGQARALYGADVILARRADWRTPSMCAAADAHDAQPVLLEVNFSADLGTVTRFYPGFVADSFDLMYADLLARYGAEGAEGAVDAARDAFGKVDLLVNTGGGTGMPELFHEMPLDGLTSGLDGLLRGIMLPCRAAVPHMMKRKRGVILNVASDAGKVETPGEAVIGAGMAGVMMFSRALALEAKRDNIRVNCLTPSIVRGTPLYDELMAHPFASKIFAKAEKMASLGVVEADELAQLAVFLASPEVRDGAAGHSLKVAHQRLHYTIERTSDMSVPPKITPRATRGHALSHEQAHLVPRLGALSR